MGKFGWSLPPGVTTLPGEEEYPCEVCNKMVDDCICPECPVCYDVGSPICYCYHGLVITKEQIDSFYAAEEEWEETAKAEQEYFEQLRADEIEDY